MKLDKREIILCLLFACLFITMIFIRAFAVDAVEPVNVTTLPHHGKQSALEILEDDTSYNSWLDDLRDAGAEVSTNVWSTAEDMARNLLAYGVGCVANVTEEVLQVAFPDLEHYLGDMYFDWDSLEWEFTTPDDVEEFIATGLEPYAYDSGTAVKGNWRLCPQDFYYNYYSRNVNVSSVSSSDQVWVCMVYRSSSQLSFLVSSKNPNFGATISVTGFNYSFGSTSTYVVGNNTYYYKSMSSGLPYSNSGGMKWDSSTGESVVYYSNVSVALAALWGDGEPVVDPVLNGDVIYIDDPQFDPLGYYPSTGLDFTKIVNEGNTNNYDYSVVNNYNTYYPTTYTFDIPYWLKVPSTVPKIYDLPSDFDYGNIQFDYEADSSFLDGAGIVQDVFEILPSQLQNLIILFGAGTCAFIFLRR